MELVIYTFTLEIKLRSSKHLWATQVISLLSFSQSQPWDCLVISSEINTACCLQPNAQKPFPDKIKTIPGLKLAELPF